MAPEQAEAQRREVLVEAAQALVRAGVMSHTGHINISSRFDGERMLLSSTGLVTELRPESLAVVGLDGQVQRGTVSASTREIIGMHTAVYRARPPLAAVVHTHSPHLTAFALAHQPVPCRYEALLRHGQTDAVPVVAWAPRGSDASVRGIAEALDRHPGSLAVLLANHGVLVGGASPTAAAKLLIVLEEAAEAELRAQAIGGARDLPPGAGEDVRRAMVSASAVDHAVDGGPT